MPGEQPHRGVPRRTRLGPFGHGGYLDVVFVLGHLFLSVLSGVRFYCVLLYYFCQVNVLSGRKACVLLCFCCVRSQIELTKMT